MATKWISGKHNFEYFTLKLKADTKQHFCKILFSTNWQQELCPDMDTGGLEWANELF